MGVFAQLSLSHTKSSFIGNYGVSCNGAADGWINLTVSGGATPYSILWSNAATTEDISGLGAGTFSVVVTDSLGAVDSLSVVLAQPDELSLVLTPANVSCFGAGDGKITSFVLGGTPSLSYLWSNSSTEQDLDDIGPGSYSLTVTDANGCTDVSDATVVEPPQLTISLFSPVNSMGFNVSAGARDGSINLTVSGGIPDFVYAWSTGAISEDVSELFSGTYSVRVEDHNGCFVIDSTTLTSEDSLPAGLVPFTTQGNWLNPNSDFIGSRNASPIVFKTTGTEQMRITPSGDLGIGIPTPTTKFDLNGSARFRSSVRMDNIPLPPIDNTTHQYQMLMLDNEGNLVTFPSPLNLRNPGPIGSGPGPATPECSLPFFDWYKNQDYSDATTIDTHYGGVYLCPIERSLGLGTTTPEEEFRLHVVGLSKFDGPVYLNALNSTANPLQVGGNVNIIGNLTAVNIKAHDVLVCIGGCDFVFDPGYKLLTINELHKFIEKNNHLPDILPASEMNDNHVALGEMNSKLLQKVEELTLYIIQLNQRISDLESTK